MLIPSGSQLHNPRGHNMNDFCTWAVGTFPTCDPNPNLAQTWLVILEGRDRDQM